MWMYVPAFGLLAVASFAIYGLIQMVRVARTIPREDKWEQLIFGMFLGVVIATGATIGGLALLAAAGSSWQR